MLGDNAFEFVDPIKVAGKVSLNFVRLELESVSAAPLLDFEPEVEREAIRTGK
jgi:hypothetical protein